MAQYEERHCNVCGEMCGLSATEDRAPKTRWYVATVGDSTQDQVVCCNRWRYLWKGDNIFIDFIVELPRILCGHDSTWIIVDI